MTTTTFDPKGSTNYDAGDSSYPGSIRSGWVIANSDANTATTQGGSFWDLTDESGDTFSVFSGPTNTAFSTILLRHRRLSTYTTTATSVGVTLIGRYRSDENTTSEWMVLPNRNKADGIATAIELTASDTNDIQDDIYRFSLTDDDTHWFDTKGCNEFAILIETAYSGSPSASGQNISVVEAKFL